MSQAEFSVRRATVDDLDVLRPMWESMRLNPPELERRLTEFQVAASAEGTVVGTVGFQMLERHARVHSEAFSDFALAEQLRPLIWERIKALAMNHGIVRLWTQEDAPFWKRNGFLPANAEVLEKLPAGWQDLPGTWLTLPLKNEEAIVALEKELAMYMSAEKQRTARAFKKARVLKAFATLLAVIFALFVGVALYYLFVKHPGLLNRQR